LKALILLAHGSRDPLGTQPLAQIRAWVQAAQPELLVREAYLSLNQPSLEDCVEDLHHSGHDSVTVLPLLVARGQHLNVELPLLMRGLQERFPAMSLRLGPHLGADEAIVGLVLARMSQAQALPVPVLP
jgi:sirohydrochlorin cobaltochelatase